MKKIIALALITLLAACESAPSGPNYPALRFGGQPYRLAVSQVQVQNNIQPTANNVEPNFPARLTDSITNWANDRLQASGGPGVLVVSIDDASVTEVKLPKKDGVKAYFTDQQDARYDGSIKVTFRVYAPGSTLAETEGDVYLTRARSLNEEATLADREDFFYKLTKDMMGAFDQEASKRIQQYFSRYMR